MFLLQSKLKRIPAYLAIQFVRFYYKEKEAINAKILKVGNCGFICWTCPQIGDRLLKYLQIMNQKLKKLIQVAMDVKFAICQYL